MVHSDIIFYVCYLFDLVLCGAMKDDKETKLTILTQGNVRLSHEYGYMVKGNDEAVCFYIDPVGRAKISCSSSSDNNCPTIFLTTDLPNDYTLTEVEFSDYQGWRFHCGGDGKSIAIALVRDE